MGINGCTSSGPGVFQVFNRKISAFSLKEIERFSKETRNRVNDFISSSIILSVFTISVDSVTLAREVRHPVVLF